MAQGSLLTAPHRSYRQRQANRRTGNPSRRFPYSLRQEDGRGLRGPPPRSARRRGPRPLRPRSGPPRLRPPGVGHRVPGRCVRRGGARAARR
ncbi:unnamed protein product, partial [Prorocentrum cordatum]